jgi:hypothetical protein
MRFEDVGNDVYHLMEDVIEMEHSHLREANICIIFDLKKRKSGDMFVLGRIKATSEELKAFAVDDNGLPYDYVLFLDKEVFIRVDDDDKKRILYHELSHCKVTEGENPYKIQGHEVETFYSEIDRNSETPRWAERLAAIASSVHDPENNEAPED